MSLGLQLWLAKRSSDRFVRMHARGDLRHRMRQQWNDYEPRGIVRNRCGLNNRGYRKAVFRATHNATLPPTNKRTQ